MDMCGRWANQSIAGGLVLVLLLASLLFALRGVVMFHPEPGQVHVHGTTHPHGPEQSQHVAHCPLCFLLMLLPDLFPPLMEVWAASFAGQLWLAEQRAKDAFLAAIGARGPPAA